MTGAAPRDFPRLVLASRSPRRRDLLSTAGYDFDVEPSGVDESMDGDPRPDDLVRELSRRKAAAVSERRPGDVIIGSDTIVCLDGTIFGIPRDRAESRRFLERLSGRTHEVHTGVAVGRDGVFETASDVARVRFCELGAELISEYVSSGEGDDKAGGYAFQGEGRRLIAGIEGDASTVIGLPLRLVADMLSKWKIVSR